MEKKIELEEVVEKDFSGYISVVKNGAVIFQKIYGYADLSNRICDKLQIVRMLIYMIKNMMIIILISTAWTLKEQLQEEHLLQF